MRLLAILTALAISTSLAYAEEKAMIVMHGKASAELRAVALRTFSGALTGAGWSLAPSPAPSAQDAIVACAGQPQPWSCIEPIVRDNQIDRVVVLTVDRDAAGSDVVVVARLVTAGSNEPRVTRDFCLDCREDTLTAIAKTLSATVIDHAKDVDPVGPTLPAEKPTAEIPIVPARPTEQRSAVPFVLIGGGVVVVAAGTIYSLRVDPPPVTERQPKYLYSGPAIAIAAAGGVAVAAGLYLWLRARRSTPTVAVTPGGGVVGWMQTF